MKPFLIVKLGSTFPCLIPTHGDFEDWIRMRLGVPTERVTVHNGRRERLPDAASFAGVVLTGSHTMVNHHEPWSEAAAQWTTDVVDRQIPLLGICYGHQLLAYAMGGEVGPNPTGREFGTVPISLHDSAHQDLLFAETPPQFLAQTGHTQTVLRLPPIATRLAFSPQDACQAFAVGRRAWGVQFHPEYDTKVARTYIEQTAEVLKAEGHSPELLLDKVCETPHAALLLRRFAQIADGALA